MTNEQVFVEICGYNDKMLLFLIVLFSFDLLQSYKICYSLHHMVCDLRVRPKVDNCTKKQTFFGSYKKYTKCLKSPIYAI